MCFKSEVPISFLQNFNCWNIAILFLVSVNVLCKITKKLQYMKCARYFVKHVDCIFFLYVLIAWN